MVDSDLPQIGMATRGVPPRSHVADRLHDADADTPCGENGRHHRYDSRGTGGGGWGWRRGEGGRVACRLLALPTEARRGRPRPARCRHARTPAGAAAGTRRLPGRLSAGTRRPPPLGSARSAARSAAGPRAPDCLRGGPTRAPWEVWRPKKGRPTNTPTTREAHWRPTRGGCPTISCAQVGATPTEVRPIGRMWAPNRAGDRLKGLCWSSVGAAQRLQAIPWGSPPDGISAEGTPGAGRTPRIGTTTGRFGWQLLVSPIDSSSTADGARRGGVGKAPWRVGHVLSRERMFS